MVVAFEQEAVGLVTLASVAVVLVSVVVMGVYVELVSIVVLLVWVEGETVSVVVELV